MCFASHFGQYFQIILLRDHLYIYISFQKKQKLKLTKLTQIHIGSTFLLIQKKTKTAPQIHVGNSSFGRIAMVALPSQPRMKMMTGSKLETDNQPRPIGPQMVVNCKGNSPGYFREIDRLVKYFSIWPEFLYDIMTYNINRDTSKNGMFLLSRFFLSSYELICRRYDMKVFFWGECCDT